MGINGFLSTKKERETTTMQLQRVFERLWLCSECGPFEEIVVVVVNYDILQPDFQVLGLHLSSYLGPADPYQQKK